MNIPKSASMDFWESVTALGLPLFPLLIFLLVWGIIPSFPLLPAVIFYLLLEVTAAVIKLLFPKERPIAQLRRTLFEKYQSGSFPSIHSARMSYLVCVLLFSQLLSPFLLSLFIGIGLLVAYSRFRLKKHYISDILGGFGLGIFFGILFSLFT